MKHQRLLAVLTALLLLWLPLLAQATSHIAYFLQPDGVEAYTLEEMKTLTAPEGLEEMYQLFCEGNPYATSHVFRMPNGRALLSISCLEMSEEGSTDELYSSSDIIAQGIADELGSALAATPEFFYDELYGQHMLVTEITLNTSNGPLDVQGAVFCRGVDLIEIWTAYPNASTYLFDLTAAAELKSDLIALEELEDSLDLSIPEGEDANGTSQIQSLLPDGEVITQIDKPSPAPSEVVYMKVTANDGTFRMNVPPDTMVIHTDTDANTLARARNLLADFEGGTDCFDLWYADVKDLGGWLLISREYGLAAQVFVTPADSLAGKTAQELILLEEPILDLWKSKYDHAKVAEECTIVELDGMEHAAFFYELEKGDVSLLNIVMTAVDKDYLFELDVNTILNAHAEDELLSEAIMMMLESLDYLPDMEL